jgi:mRNA interferase MazF
MIKGDVYLAELDPSQGSEQAGTRPVIIVSRDAINRVSPVVIVVPLAHRGNKGKLFPSHVEIKTGDGGLTVDSVALCEQVRAIPTTHLIKPLGHLTESVVSQINVALKIVLDLP